MTAQPLTLHLPDLDGPELDGPELVAVEPVSADPVPGQGLPGIPLPRVGSRLQRAKMPQARQVAVDAAVEFGVCIRPQPLRRTNLDTGETAVVDVPCGATLTAVCPPCAERARRLRAQQCREGWHLGTDPDLTPDPSTETQRALVTERADITAVLHDAELDGDELLAEAASESLADVDADLADTGVRGNLDPGRPEGRRVRSTRRRQDTPDLPARPSNGSTLGRTFTDPKTGRVFRPSLFLTVTLPSYGPVRAGEGTPVHPASYDYPRAARDALHFAKLLDRLVQNLRRVAGYDLQYFAAIEPQRRLAPHAHFAIRGTLPRATVRDVVAATYHQVWWPITTEVIYAGDRVPVWSQDHAGYVDPDTADPLPTWDEALDGIGDQDEPAHVARFGTQVDAVGVLAGTPQAEKCIGYLVKYLTKTLGDNLAQPDDHHHQGEDVEGAQDPERAARWTVHRDRLVDALRYEPCAPTCPNWLRYGVQPRNPREGQRPGCCRSKAHKPTHLGHAGRRVLVSRKWTGKTLADHRADRRAFVLDVLGITPDPANGQTTPATSPGPDPAQTVAWEHAKTTDPDVAPLSRRLLLAIAQRQRWRTEYRAARDAPDDGPELPAVAPPDPGTDQPTPGRLNGQETPMPSPANPLLSLDEAADALGTGLDFIVQLVNAGHLDHTHDGDTLCIPETALIAYAVTATDPAIPAPTPADVTELSATAQPAPAPTAAAA